MHRWRIARVPPTLAPMARTRKCPQCGMAVVKPRDVCPRCEAPLAEGPRWDDPSQTRSAREKKLRSTNVRMRNSGALLFVVGVVLMSQGVDAEANTLTPFGSIGVLCIIFGTIIFLWGWKLLQTGK